MKRARIGQIQKLDYSGKEALNTICSNLLFVGKNVKKIIFTSCNPNDGKSFLVMQIARNLADRGRNVVIVDADLRKSHLVRKHKIETDGEWIGLAHFLAGYASMEDVVYKTNLRNVHFVPIGKTVINPVSMLDSKLMGDFLDLLSKEFDVVLVDAPPVGVVIDAALIAQICDGAILSVHYNETRRAQIKDVQRQMQQSGCPILGAVINKVTSNHLSDKKYYNKAYYTHYQSDDHSD